MTNPHLGGKFAKERASSVAKIAIRAFQQTKRTAEFDSYFNTGKKWTSSNEDDFPVVDLFYSKEELEEERELIQAQEAPKEAEAVTAEAAEAAARADAKAAAAEAAEADAAAGAQAQAAAQAAAQAVALRWQEAPRLKTLVMTPPPMAPPSMTTQSLFSN